MEYFILIISLAIIGLLAFLLGRKLAPVPRTESKTTTFLIKSIQAIAELAVLEYITEGVAEIKEKKASLITVRWKRGLLRYNVKEFYVLDLLQDKTKLAFKKIFSLSYPEYTTDIAITGEAAPETTRELPAESSGDAER